VANFKSNLTLSQVQIWLDSVPPTPNALVAPSFLHLPLTVGRWPLAVCSQDVSPFPPGSYTGAISARELKDLGVTYAIVGHSERRRYFHETSVDVASKVKELVEVGITPILCLEDKDINSQFASLATEHYASCIYCFEPGDGLGGTTTASLDDIRHIKQAIKEYAPTARFMYGGSVTPDNVESLLPLKLDGLLVATASLDPNSFISIIEKVSHVG